LVDGSPQTDLMLHHAFGLQFHASFALPELPTAEAGSIDLEVSLSPPDATAAAFSGALDPPVVRLTILGDGCEYRTERGRAGDYRIVYGERASFHLANGANRLLCSPADVDDPAWRRFLLDSALGTAALVRGFEALHAGAVELPQGVVAVLADQGGGKSTLVAELVSRGGHFFCDDILCLSRSPEGIIVAHPGPPLMNLPPVLPDGTPAEKVGGIVAILDGERWVAIDTAATKPRPVAAIVLLERGDHPALHLERMPSSVAPLLHHSLLSGLQQDRLERRFALLSDLVSATPLLRVLAPSDLASSVVAVGLEAALAADPPRVTGA
jgi:hypothetical protein